MKKCSKHWWKNLLLNIEGWIVTHFG